MAISSPGIGSGLDVNTIVSQLIAADRQGPQSQIDTQRRQFQTQISSLGSLSSALSSIQSSLTSLADGTAFSRFTATVGNVGSGTAAFSATASATASVGTYSVRVDNLATAQKLSSNPFSASTSTVGTGTLSISVGSHTMNLTIDDSNKTLSGIANAINRSSTNPGVTASVLTAVDGAHLVITSNSTGLANRASISTSGGDGGLSALTYNAGTGLGSMSRTITATDAHLQIDGSAVTSATNSVTNAITGVNINLTADTAGATQTLNVTRNNDSTKNTIGAFVASYNGFIATAKTLASYDPVTRQAGPLLGDSTLRSISNQLLQSLSSRVGGTDAAYHSLSDIGIQFQVDGTISVNATKLDAALSANSTQVAAVFSGTTGIGHSLNSMLTTFLSSNGVLNNRTQSITRQTEQLDQSQTDLDRRLGDEQLMYQRQFTALDTLLNSLKSTSNFLTQQLASFNNFNSNH